MLWLEIQHILLIALESIRASWIKQLKHISTSEHEQEYNQSLRSLLNSSKEESIDVFKKDASFKKVRTSLINF